METRCETASRTLLRWGIVLVGARVTIGQIVGLGPMTLLAVVLILLATLGAGIVVARLLGLTGAFGMLAGGSVAICGASAALALATTLGERRVHQGQLAFVLVGISAASAAAMCSPGVTGSTSTSPRSARCGPPA